MKDKSIQSGSGSASSKISHKNQGVLGELQKLSLRRGINLLVSRVTVPCSKYDAGFCMDYLDFTLGEDDKKEFENHFPNCPACLLNLLKIIEADKKVLSDPILGESFQNISVKRALEKLGIKCDEIPEEEEPLLLAASPEIKALKDSASGIGVSPDTGRGQIIECIAHVFEEKDQGGSLHIFGSQVEEKEVEGKRIKVTPPLEMIQEVLSTLFKNQVFFSSYRCSFRDITIQVSQEKESYLTEGLSLSLAAAAAVYLALKGRSLSSDVVFSGNIEITGRIRKVSHLGLKLRLSRESGKEVMVLPQENKEDIKRLSQEGKGDLQFQYFDTLDQVFHYLEQITTKRVKLTEKVKPVSPEIVLEEPVPVITSVTPVKIYIGARQKVTVKGLNLKSDVQLMATGVQFRLKKSSPRRLVFRAIADKSTREGKIRAALLWQGREIYSFELSLAYGRYIDTLFRFDRYPIRASINISFYLIFLLSGAYYSLSDFLLALSLKPFLPIRFYDLLHVLALTLIVGNLIFGFIKDKGHSPIRSALFYLMFFLVVSLSLFVTVPYVYDEVDIYNKTSYYLKSPRLKGLFSDVPNFPVLNFEKYLERVDAKGAFSASQKVKDLKDYIQDVYIPLTGLFEKEEYQNRKAAIESTLRFLQGVDQHCSDQSLRRKILRGLQAANWIAEKYGDEELMSDIRKRQDLVSGNQRVVL